MTNRIEADQLSTVPHHASGRRLRWPSAILRFIRHKPLGGIGLVLIAVVLVAAIFGDAIATHNPNRTDPFSTMASPSGSHLLGTDNLGRDIYSRVIYGARISAVVGPLAVLVALSSAVVLGGVTGFIGGKVDLLTQRLLDVLMAFPPLVILISAVQLLPIPRGEWDLKILSLSESQQRAFYLILVLGIIMSFGAARVVRSAVLEVRSTMYIEAARAVGTSEGRLFFRYALPNIFPILIVLATISLGAAILVEASTSFLGVGLPPDIPSWGRMLNEGRPYIHRSINLTIWPGLAIALTVFAFNMLGDALRDVLDPRLRGR